MKNGKAASKAALLVSIGQTLSLAEGAIWSRLRGLTEAKLGALGFCYRASHKKKDHIGCYETDIQIQKLMQARVKMTIRMNRVVIITNSMPPY